MRITEAARDVAGMAAIGAFFIGAGLVVLAVGAGGCALHRAAAELAEALLGVCAEVIRLRPDEARKGAACPTMLAAQHALECAGRLA